jgi:hypothetical protein
MWQADGNHWRWHTPTTYKRSDKQARSGANPRIHTKGRGRMKNSEDEAGPHKATHLNARNKQNENGNTDEEEELEIRGGEEGERRRNANKKNIENKAKISVKSTNGRWKKN